MESSVEISGLEDNPNMINQKDSLSTSLESSDSYSNDQKDNGNDYDVSTVWSVILFVHVTILFMFAQLILIYRCFNPVYTWVTSVLSNLYDLSINLTPQNLLSFLSSQGPGYLLMGCLLKNG